MKGIKASASRTTCSRRRNLSRIVLRLGDAILQARALGAVVRIKETQFSVYHAGRMYLDAASTMGPCRT
jgi:hypothetical protein